ncbi:MAG: PilZ domain-containing protein [Desulfobacterales bacterium]|nr:PilZ domain-containing protein [Desulfobacterales bacterium]
MNEERRKNKRHGASKGAFAAVEDTTKAGQICNISRGGACFTYMVDGSVYRTDLPEKESLTLVGSHCLVKGLSCRVVGESHFSGSFSFMGLGMRKCRIEFKGLNQAQLAELDRYIACNSAPVSHSNAV